MLELNFNYQEIIELRSRSWKGLPSPPALTTGKPRRTRMNQKDPSASSSATSLGLSRGDPEPRISQSPPLESETDPVPAYPVAQSPPFSISTLCDFTITDISDESPIESTPASCPSTLPCFVGCLLRLAWLVLASCLQILRRTSPRFLRLYTSQGMLVWPSFRGIVPLTISVYRFLEKNEVPGFATFSSLLRITARYELPTVRSQLLEAVHDAYPEISEGLAPSKPLGEAVFNGPTPHPNAVLNLFVQQELTSTLPMAYYTAARRELDSLMDRHLPWGTTLPPDILQPAIRGLMTLREMERDGTYRLIFGPNDSHPCLASNCPSRAPTGTVALQAYQKVFDHIAVGSSQLGTRALRVPEFYEDREGGPRCISLGVCRNCVERWESEHADLRKKAWARLPDVFGLRG